MVYERLFEPVFGKNYRMPVSQDILFLAFRDHFATTWKRASLSWRNFSKGMTRKEMYFAFGSNMNPERMRERKAFFTERVGARLFDYKMTFRLEDPTDVVRETFGRKRTQLYTEYYTLLKTEA